MHDRPKYPTNRRRKLRSVDRGTVCRTYDYYTVRVPKSKPP